jgi:hypothetical protein
MIFSKRIFTTIAFLMAFAFSSQSLATCFSVQGGGSFRVVDDRTLDIKTSFGEIYRLGVDFCWDLPFARKISFQSRFVCQGDNVLVFSNQQGPPERCWIQNIERLH